MKHDSSEEVHGLIRVLLDSRAPVGDRGDAAMDLGLYDNADGLAALLRVATDPAEDPHVADEAGQSLWQIWDRLGARDETAVERLHPEARKFFNPHLRDRTR